MFLSRAFSKSEMNICQILRLNYDKKLNEWWTDDVDEDCISFNLYRNTETSIILFKKMERRFQIRRVLPDLSTMFLFRRTNSN